MAREVTYGPMQDIASPDIKEALIGWRIVDVGITTQYTSYLPGDHEPSIHNPVPREYTASVEGGLTLLLEKDGQQRKVILGYTELGEWLEHVHTTST